MTKIRNDNDTVKIEVELTQGIDDDILKSLASKSQTASNIVSALLRWANENKGQLLDAGVLDDSVDPNPL